MADSTNEPEITDVEIDVPHYARDFARQYPHLDHYVNFEGLEGIWKRGVICADYYDDIFDGAVNATVLRGLLAQRLAKWMANRQRGTVKSEGSLQERLSTMLPKATHVVQSHFEILFEGAPGQDISIPPLAHPFVASFFYSLKRVEDEARWRRFHEGERYCVVFDTQKLCAIFDREGEQFGYSHAYFGPVIYSDDGAVLNQICARLVRQLKNIVLAVEAEQTPPVQNRQYMDYISAVVLLSSSFYRHDREIRMTLSTYSAETLELAYKRTKTLQRRPAKSVFERQTRLKKVRYIKLFEGADLRSSVRRVLVRPGRDVTINLEKAQQLLGGVVPIQIDQPEHH